MCACSVRVLGCQVVCVEEGGRQIWEPGPNRTFSLSQALPGPVKQALARKQGGSDAAEAVKPWPSGSTGADRAWAFSHVGGYMAARDAGIDADGYVAVVRGAGCVLMCCARRTQGGRYRVVCGSVLGARISALCHAETLTV